MKEIDFLSLDGRSLLIFALVSEELSISKAAERLGVTQSAVSHTLNKLRQLLDDPLFVRSGRHIVATEKAIAMKEPVSNLLEDLRKLTQDRAFDPYTETLDITVAANDTQRDFIFPELIRGFRRQGIDTNIQFISSSIPDTDLLRSERCQLLITPFPPEGPDIYQSRLFDDRSVVYYDPSVRSAPKTLDDYLAADHIDVCFDDRKRSNVHLYHIDSVKLKKPKVSVSNFSAIASFLKGTDMITTQLRLVKDIYLKDFACTELPFESDTCTMYMVWHSRHNLNRAHRWLRDRIKAQVESRIQSSI